MIALCELPPVRKKNTRAARGDSDTATHLRRQSAVGQAPAILPHKLLKSVSKCKFRFLLVLHCAPSASWRPRGQRVAPPPRADAGSLHPRKPSGLAYCLRHSRAQRPVSSIHPATSPPTPPQPTRYSCRRLLIRPTTAPEIRTDATHCRRRAPKVMECRARNGKCSDNVPRLCLTSDDLRQYQLTNVRRSKPRPFNP